MCLIGCWQILICYLTWCEHEQPLDALILILKLYRHWQSHDKMGDMVDAVIEVKRTVDLGLPVGLLHGGPRDSRLLPHRNYWRAVQWISTK